MLALCRERARREGFEPTLFLQPLHELAPPRRYGTIVVCGVFGLGSTRAQDQEALRRFHQYLEPGGTLVLDNGVPYANEHLRKQWTKEGRRALPEAWTPQGQGARRRTADGSEYELRDRTPRSRSTSSRRSCSSSGWREERRRITRDRGADADNADVPSEMNCS